MTRKYKWTIEIEIDAVEVEKHLTFNNDLAMNDATAYDMVADTIMYESPPGSFKVRSVKVQKPDAAALTFALQFGEGPRLQCVK